MEFNTRKQRLFYMFAGYENDMLRYSGIRNWDRKDDTIPNSSYHTKCKQYTLEHFRHIPYKHYYQTAMHTSKHTRRTQK